MTPEQSDDLDGILDRFEARVYRRWSFRLERIRAEHRRRLEASGGLSRTQQDYDRHICPSLDHYDGRVESH